MQMTGLELDPLNTAFTWHDHRGPFELLTDRQAAAFDDDGFVVLHDVLSAAEIAEVTGEIDPAEAAYEQQLRDLGGRFLIARADEITFTTHLAARSPILRRFVTNPVFGALNRDLIGPDVRLYWDQAVYKKPHTTAKFPWHQDNGYAFIEPQAYVTCWIPLVDATEANGCPWVVPGVHHLGTLRHHITPVGLACFEAPPLEAVPVPVRVGDVVVFSSLTPHLTGPNLTDDVRKAYIVQFAPDGAELVTRPDPTEPARRVPAADPDRQFLVLDSGRSGEADPDTGRAS